MSDLTWDGDYARRDGWTLCAHPCVGGAKWSLDYGDEEAIAYGKVAWDDRWDCLAVARELAEQAYAAAATKSQAKRGW